MAQEHQFEVFLRDDKGKGASRRLRREERKIPAIVYGANKDPVAISMWHNDLKKALEHESIYTQILTLKMGDKEESVILKDLQRHPFKPLLTHADFLRVEKNQELHVNVPLHFVNEDTAHAIKLEGGILAREQTEVEIIALPQDLPEFIEVDVNDIAMDQTIHLSDLKLPANVRLAALAQGEDHDLAVASIHKPRGAKVEDEGESEEAGEEGGE